METKLYMYTGWFVFYVVYKLKGEELNRNLVDILAAPHDSIEMSEDKDVIFKFRLEWGIQQ